MADKLATEGTPLKKGHKVLRQVPARATVAWHIIEEQGQLHLSKREIHDFKFMLDAQSHYTHNKMIQDKMHTELNGSPSAPARPERIQALALLINGLKPWRSVK